MRTRQGCHNAADWRDMDKLLPLVWPSEADMERARLHYHTSVLASGIGLLDCLIAFTAVGHGNVLCTFNVKHYRTVAVLTTEQPYIHT